MDPILGNGIDIGYRVVYHHSMYEAASYALTRVTTRNSPDRHWM